MTDYEYTDSTYTVEVTDEMRREASKDMSTKRGDSDRERSPDQKKTDDYLGDIAELAFAEAMDDILPDVYCERTPDDVSSGHVEQDFLVGEDEVRVDVKGRDLRRYGDPDLLVRVKDNDGYLESQLYPQVDVEYEDDVPVRAHVVGFATDLDVSVGEHFTAGSFPECVKSGHEENFKLLVPRGRLHDISSLSTFVSVVESQRVEERDGEFVTVASHPMWDEFKEARFGLDGLWDECSSGEA